MAIDACSPVSWTQPLKATLCAKSTRLPMPTTQPTMHAAVANPAKSQLAENAAKLSKEATKLNATAQRTKTTLANFPKAPMMCVTNAAHIFFGGK